MGIFRVEQVNGDDVGSIFFGDGETPAVERQSGVQLKRGGENWQVLLSDCEKGE